MEWNGGWRLEIVEGCRENERRAVLSRMPLLYWNLTEILV